MNAFGSPEPDPELLTIRKIAARVGIKPVRTSDNQFYRITVWRFPQQGALVENFVIPIGRVRMQNKNIPITIRALRTIRATTGQPHRPTPHWNILIDERKQRRALIGINHQRRFISKAALLHNSGKSIISGEALDLIEIEPTVS
jgi:hypothetical protein